MYSKGFLLRYQQVSNVLPCMQGAATVTTAVSGNPQQKAKLLWGSKRDAATAGVVPALGNNRWDTAEFTDSQQKLKFQRLMGAGHAGVPPPQQQVELGAVAADPDAELTASMRVMDSQMQQKVLTDVEKQFIAGMRRADGRTVGLGL
eukprot:GHUV01028604.1.p1 GENE.GHUV01028604.1~~GHUV01028604.1.p1  ORF type:complete len:147 (-),score=49.66 GHUV01028604.1:262-702(-)